MEYSQKDLDLDFYSEAFELLAETDHYRVILNRDYYGNVIEEPRLTWIISIAVEQGYLPLVGYFDDNLKQFVFISSVNGTTLRVLV